MNKESEDREIDILKKLLTLGSYISTKDLDQVLEEVWGNEYDAQMHCNSLMRRGWIDYEGDGDWELLYALEDLDYSDE